MPANPPPQAPQSAQDGAGAGGAIPGSRIIQGVLANARRLYGAGYLSGEQMAEFELLSRPVTDDEEWQSVLAECSRELLEWRYRAALARGVWWG